MGILIEKLLSFFWIYRASKIFELWVDEEAYLGAGNCKKQKYGLFRYFLIKHTILHQQ